jgi:hypothetical protein
MGKRLLLGLILALVLSAGALHAQDSSDDSDTSDTSDTSDAAAFSPGPPSAIDANTAIDATDAMTVDFATQQAIDAITNPWGGVPGPALPTDLEIGPSGNPIVAGPEEAGTFSPASPTPPPEPGPGVPSTRRAQIHAVIVSNLSDPSQVLSGNVNLTGGIIALGPPTPSQKPGRWDPNVQITPDPDLLNGSKIPPLVPNVIDVRITHYEVTATIESGGGSFKPYRIQATGNQRLTI